MKKIKWVNVVKIILLLICVGIIVYDYYRLVFKFGCFTYFGLATNILSWFIVSTICEDFKEQLKSIQSYQPKHAKDTK